MKKNYLNTTLCKECGGKCCKQMPGIAYPIDFKKPLLNSLVEAFKSGKWAIDWYEGDPTNAKKLSMVYYVRPKIKGIKTLFDPSWGGECTFLTESGCTLKPDERPMTCRMLEPVSFKTCIFHKAKNKAECARAWLLHQDTILKAAKLAGEPEEDVPETETLGFLDALIRGGVR